MIGLVHSPQLGPGHMLTAGRHNRETGRLPLLMAKSRETL